MAARIRHLLILAGLAAAISQGADAHDTPKAAPLAWQCSQELDPSFQVLCFPHLTAEALEGRSPIGAPAPREAAQGWRGDMRPVAQRGDVEVFSAEAWRVPLHAAPSDPVMVRTLLQSVLCGKRPACSVLYQAEPTRMTSR